MCARPYTPEDWARVCQIDVTARRDELAAAGLAAAYLTPAQTSQNERFHNSEVHVAELGHQVLRFVAFTREELAWLYVDRAAFRRGIGSTLIRAALAETRAPLSKQVLEGNDAALALCLKNGFQITGSDAGRMPGNTSFRVSVTELRHPGAA